MGKVHKTTKARALIKAEGKARWKTKRFFFGGGVELVGFCYLGEWHASTLL